PRPPAPYLRASPRARRGPAPETPRGDRRSRLLRRSRAPSDPRARRRARPRARRALPRAARGAGRLRAARLPHRRGDRADGEGVGVADPARPLRGRAGHGLPRAARPVVSRGPSAPGAGSLGRVGDRVRPHPARPRAAPALRVGPAHALRGRRARQGAAVPLRRSARRPPRGRDGSGRRALLALRPDRLRGVDRAARRRAGRRLRVRAADPQPRRRALRRGRARAGRRPQRRAAHPDDAGHAAALRGPPLAAPRDADRRRDRAAGRAARLRHEARHALEPAAPAGALRPHGRLRRRRTGMARLEIGEAFVGAGAEAAHVNTVLGPRDGPAGAAWATALATPSAGHAPFVVVLRPGLPAKPPTLFVNKAAIGGETHAALTW